MIKTQQIISHKPNTTLGIKQTSKSLSSAPTPSDSQALSIHHRDERYKSYL